MHCHFLPYENTDGAQNMAIDHALLEAVDAQPDRAVLRTYGWSEPTLSLGYFQKIAAVQRDPRWADVPIVRRPTGGGALWHHHEITYALVVPRSLPMARRPSDLYRAIHGAIAQALQALGFAAHRRGEPEGSQSRPFLCFLDHDSEDILLNGYKIVGSAQRRRPHAVLQHGSLLLAHSEQTPELLGLFDLTHSPIDLEALTGPICQAIAERLELDPLASALSALELERVESLSKSVYRNPEWTEKR